MFDYIKDQLAGGVVLALGSFDGIHLGHRKVLENALDMAEKMRLVPAVMLFDTHPKAVLDGKAPSVLLDENERDTMLKEMGFRIVRANFAEIKDLEPRDFLLKIYCKLNVRAICCGFNYHYGRAGRGDVASLQESCKKLGVELSASEPVCYEGEPISSSRIRQAISDGDIRSANAMLGREFSYKLEVVEGDRRGRVLGFPTINQFFAENFISPKYGVYCSKVKLGRNWYPAVTNIGVRPTIKSESLRSESHIIGFDGDLYHQNVRVYLLEYMRGEADFGNLDNLRNQIAHDKEVAEGIYQNEETEG